MNALKGILKILFGGLGFTLIALVLYMGEIGYWDRWTLGITFLLSVGLFSLSSKL